MGCFVALALLAATTGVVLAIVAFQRTLSLERQLSAQRMRLDDIELRRVPRPRADERRRRAETPAPAAEPRPSAGSAPATGAEEDGGSEVEEPPVPPLAEEPPEAPSPVPPPSAPPPRLPESGEITLEPPGKQRPRIEWERWIGVRGAAILGAVVLVIAGLLFVRYSIEHGLIPPPVRVAFLALSGIVALAFSERLRRRGYEVNANSLAGAATVLLYGAVWAARVLYELIGWQPAWVLMVLITVACGVLSWRYASLLIAVLGTVGGFATPLLLSTGSDRPIGLFAYILLLDLGLLVLVRQRGWSALLGLAFSATVLFQGLWIFLRMDAERALIGVGVVTLFAVFFAVAAAPRRTRGDEAGPDSPAVQMASVLVPFVFAVYFAARADFGPHFYQVGGLMLLLSGLGEWVARQRRQPAFGLAVALADLAVFGVWLARTRVDTAVAWESVGIAAALATVFHLSFELDRRRGTLEGLSSLRSLPSSLVAPAGLFALLALRSLFAADPSPWPWLAGWVFLAALGLRQTLPAERRVGAMVVPGALAGALTLFFLAHRRELGAGDPSLLLAVVAGLALLLHLPQLRDRFPSPEWLDRGAALFALVFLFGLFGEAEVAAVSSLEPWLFFGLGQLLALSAVLAATRLGSGGWYLGSLLLLVLVHSGWSFGPLQRPWGEPAALLGFGAEMLAVILFTAWPFVTAAAFRNAPPVWYAAVAAGPLWFLALREAFETAFGDRFVGLLPLILAALAIGALVRSRVLFAAAEEGRRRNVAWFSAVALGFVAVAIPLQLEKEWITLGWALQGAVLMWLWRRFDLTALKYFSWVLLALVTVRLVANPALLSYHPRTGLPVLNWLAYTYLVPVACLLIAAKLSGDREVARRVAWEEALYGHGHPVGAIGCGLAAIAVGFVWINLSVADFFSSGEAFRWSFERLPARDLTLSLAWAAYALLLLALGMARRSVGLRWISLVFLLLTIGKVFLYDLGELEDLYRVASLVGLAFSLILVSLAYQRFVFRRSSGEETS